MKNVSINIGLDRESQKGGKRFKFKKLYLLILALLLSGGGLWYYYTGTSNEKLFEKFYERYEMKYDRTSTQIQAINSYNEGRYTEAIHFFRKADTLNVSYKFYLAVSYSEIKKYHNSIKLLEEIATSGTGYAEDAKWYLALCYLKVYKNEEAKELFMQIIDEGGIYRDKARKILNKLNS